MDNEEVIFYTAVVLIVNSELQLNLFVCFFSVVSVGYIHTNTAEMNIKLNFIHVNFGQNARMRVRQEQRWHPKS